MPTPRNPFRALRLTLVFALIALACGGIWFYSAQERAMRQKVAQDLTAIAQLKADQIVAWRQDQIDDAVSIRQTPRLADLADRWLAQGTEQDARDLRALFQSLAVQHDFRDVMLVDPAGRILLDLDSQVLLHAEYKDALAQAVSSGRAVLTDLHADEQVPSPHISAVTPLYRDQAQSGRPFAALVLVCDAAEFLFPLIQSWPVPSNSAETMLIRREGDHALFLNELRHRKGTALKFRVPRDRDQVEALLAMQGKQGFVQGKDYRGAEVVAVILPIAESPWIMVSKIDTAEAFAEWRQRSLLLLGVLLGLAGLLGALALTLRQREKQAHFEALYRAEAALRAGVQRHSTTLKAIGDAVIATDAQGRVELLNPVAERLTGWTDEEARGRPLAEVFRIVDEQSRQPVESPVARVLREGMVVGLANHTVLVSRGGSECPIADSGAPMRDDAGTITGVVLVFRDQTAERLAQEALRRSEERFRAAFEQAAVGVAHVALDRRFLHANERLCTILGYSDRELLQKTTLDVTHPDDHQADLVQGQAALQGEFASYTLEKRFLRKDGRVGWGRTAVSLVRSESGEPEYFICVLEDVTEHRQLEEQLRHAQKMEAVGRLAGGVAHDINNMLTVIIGCAEMARERAGADEILQADLSEILAAANRSLSITRQLLAFARRQTISPTVLDLNATVGGMIGMLGRLIGEDIDLLWLPSAQPVPVRMDPSQIDQMLANLCLNARDAITGVGKITIETDRLSLDEAYCAQHPGFLPGDFVLLAVSDDGCGMDRTIQDSIFEPFFTTKPNDRGTGLGLATVYGIVKQNGGFINVYSEQGKGTTIRIYLQGHQGPVPERSADPSPAQVPAGGSETVLLVEDEPAIRKVSAAMLQRLGYRVLSAGAPAEALALAVEHASAIDLLVTDVVMPEMNGRLLAERLRAFCPALKVLFMSGYTANVIAHHGVLDEGVHFIQKPFSSRDLAEKISAALG